MHVFVVHLYRYICSLRVWTETDACSLCAWWYGGTDFLLSLNRRSIQYLGTSDGVQCHNSYTELDFYSYFEPKHVEIYAYTQPACRRRNQSRTVSHICTSVCSLTSLPAQSSQHHNRFYDRCSTMYHQHLLKSNNLPNCSTRT